jgi:predicted AAA+ superfamily ATPase
MNRSAEIYLQELLGLFPVVAVLGPRQCGKTTLMQAVAGSDWTRLDLERVADRVRLERDPDLFFRMESGRIAIDEAQELPALFPALRVAVDADRGVNGRYLLTGSVSPTLVKALHESLAGRMATLELGPFTAAEANGQSEPTFANAIGSLESLMELKPRLSEAQVHQAWWRGGYPEPWLKNSPRYTALWCENYLRSLLDRDLPRLVPGLNIPRFRAFVQLLAGVSGQILNQSDLARSLGVSQPTVRDWLELCDGTFLWRHLPAWDRHPTKRLVKHPKGHLRDSGLLHNLLRIRSMEELLGHPHMGNLWEGFVIEQILRQLAHAGETVRAYHYRTGAGAEVDLVLEGGFGTIPVEIKYAETGDPRKWRALRDFVAEQSCPFGILIDNGTRVRRIDDRIVAVPATCL